KGYKSMHHLGHELCHGGSTEHVFDDYGFLRTGIQFVKANIGEQPRGKPNQHHGYRKEHGWVRKFVSNFFNGIEAFIQPAPFWLCVFLCRHNSPLCFYKPNISLSILRPCAKASS